MYSRTDLCGGCRATGIPTATKMIWKILDYLCGKRLVAILPEVVPILERHGELKVDASRRERLIQISAATIDRLLASERRKHQLKGRSGTKPGTLLNHQIPIKRFADWQKDRPGFVEVDLVVLADDYLTVPAKQLPRAPSQLGTDA